MKKNEEKNDEKLKLLRKPRRSKGAPGLLPFWESVSKHKVRADYVLTLISNR